MTRDFPVAGAGLGLRRAHLGPLLAEVPAAIDFVEVAPENWLGAGGRLGRAFERIAERAPLVCHGLLLNLGGPDPLDLEFLRRLKPFLARHQVRCYGDHMSFCADAGQLYELLPMPFTGEAVMHMASRIRLVQDLLERRIAVENASYYVSLAQELSELEFIEGVLTEADCDFLLDVNNVYVNSRNHGYDPLEFLRALPGERIAYAHIAGHLRADEDLIVDTHGEAVVGPVWELLDAAYAHFGVFPTLLERDENIPPLAEVLKEVETIRAIQRRHADVPVARARRAA
ncbi:MAG TPA: DUF692 domain-containing protein [Gammaproteobacteria bacterium]|nr:DUF692 domain-containing protein [Gammaproteobacteria bacterium]